MTSPSTEGPERSGYKGRRSRLLPFVLVVACTLAAAGVSVATWLAVTDRGTEDPEALRTDVQPPAFRTKAELGASLFAAHCAACHGAEGKQGIPNPNSVLGTVPALGDMADRLMLWEREDADTILSIIENGTDPRTRAADPPFANYHRFLAQYDAVLGVIRNGSPAAKRDRAGPQPFSMPAWKDQLTEDQRVAVLAYLISIFDWDESVT